MKVVHFLLLICIAVMALTAWHQGETITQQRQLIKEMSKNPACTVPEAPKPATRRGRYT